MLDANPRSIPPCVFLAGRAVSLYKGWKCQILIYQPLLQLVCGHVIQTWPKGPEGESTGELLAQVFSLIEKDFKARTSLCLWTQSYDSVSFETMAAIMWPSGHKLRMNTKVLSLAQEEDGRWLSLWKHHYATLHMPLYVWNFMLCEMIHFPYCVSHFDLHNFWININPESRKENK